jgi:hypothetical protein
VSRKSGDSKEQANEFPVSRDFAEVKPLKLQQFVSRSAKFSLLFPVVPCKFPVPVFF